MNADEFAGLKADIEENGQAEPIIVSKGLLIDGRNRLRACQELGRQPIETELPEDQDPLKYVISHNLHRRHLTTSQRAMVAAKLATLEIGSNQHQKEGVSIDTPSPSLDDAAKRLKVGRATVARAKKVVERGSTELVQSVERGEVSLNQAVKQVSDKTDSAKQEKAVPLEKFRDFIKEVGFSQVLAIMLRRMPAYVLPVYIKVLFPDYVVLLSSERLGIQRTVLSITQAEEMKVVREGQKEIAAAWDKLLNDDKLPERDLKEAAAIVVWLSRRAKEAISAEGVDEQRKVPNQAVQLPLFGKMVPH